MANQELISGNKKALDKNQLPLVNSVGTQVKQHIQSVEGKDDLPMLDYPLGGVFESQTGISHTGLGSIVKKLVGWR